MGRDLQLRGIPQLIGEIGAGLGHDQFDDRGGIEVGVQRR
jgi:hypothetical protein